MKNKFLLFIFMFAMGLPLGGPFAFSNEALPGGEQATVDDHTINAFSHAWKSLSNDDQRKFQVGNNLFRENWVRAPASTTGRDGLGPTFNAISCSSCHFKDGRGGGENYGGLELAVLYRFSDNKEYGNQLNPFGVHPVPGEAQTQVVYYSYRGTFTDGEKYELREPSVTFRNWAYGRPSDDLVFSARVAPQMIGMGLLEKIKEEEILSGADPDDLNNDGISGEVNWVLDIESARQKIGRFGWKMEQPSVRQQVAGAFIGDMGLTSDIFPDENCPTPQAECFNGISGGSPEIVTKTLDRVTLYSQFLAVPSRRNMDNPRVADGKEVFKTVGCTGCHQPSWQIETGWAIYPYTDMLLHDMGEGLADRSIGGARVKTQWRTPPLWGIGLIPTVNGHSDLLHDGRARNIEEAILWHGGEGESSKRQYLSLDKTSRENLIEFIKSL